MNSNPEMPNLDDLKLFDSCVTLGRFVGPGCFETAEDLCGLLDRYHIAEALVHEYHARSLYPLVHANQRLLKMIAGHPRLHPVWVLEPPLQPGRQPAQVLVAEMRAAGVKAARLRLHSKGALPWVWEDLLVVLEENNIPCCLDFGSPASTLGEMSDGDVDAVHEMAQAHPQLPMILSHVMGGLGVHPAVMYLMRRVPNLYMDITGILEYWRGTAQAVGPERVLFASGMPFTDPGILISNVQYAHQFSAADKRLICGDNLRRLMGGVR